jgi:hypothetical protein
LLPQLIVDLARDARPFLLARGLQPPGRAAFCSRELELGLRALALGILVFQQRRGLTLRCAR